VLALDIALGRAGIISSLPPQQIRLELLDYPGEWLLDLPLLGLSFSEWSEQTWRRLESRPEAESFRAYAMALPAGAPADEMLAQTGHNLYRAALHRLRAEAGLCLLQPGRFLMPAPGEAPAYECFFPLPGNSRLAGLLARRYDAYVAAVMQDLAAPSFGRIDRMVVLADILSALHRGEAAFADASAALSAVATALRWRRAPGFLPGWLAGMLPLGGIARVAFAATKSDHVADRQRGNLANLVTSLTDLPGNTTTQGFALASIRATEDFVWTLEGRPVSAVRGRLIGDDRLARSYPGEVSDRPPAADFWAHPFLALPQFEPVRLPMAGRGGVPHINLDKLLCFLLEDVL
jgi:predicted YcjX-like family ATPase